MPTKQEFLSWRINGVAAAAAKYGTAVLLTWLVSSYGRDIVTPVEATIQLAQLARAVEANTSAAAAHVAIDGHVGMQNRVGGIHLTGVN